MQISFSKQDTAVVMHIVGNVDASNYTDVIDKAQQAFDDGARNLVLDLGKVSYVSSAGLMALHTVARIFSGQSVNMKEGSRPTFRALNPKQDANIRDHVKILDPQPDVEQLLSVVGLSQFFETYTDLEAALKSFAQD